MNCVTTSSSAKWFSAWPKSSHVLSSTSIIPGASSVAVGAYAGPAHHAGDACTAGSDRHQYRLDDLAGRRVGFGGTDLGQWVAPDETVEGKALVLPVADQLGDQTLWHGVALDDPGRGP